MGAHNANLFAIMGVMNPKSSPTFRYNQKEVLVKNIIRYIKDSNTKSLLDIGAGDGDVALPISKEVQYYFAVEVNNERVNNLQKLGLNAIYGIFPNTTNKITETFDMVLSSHSIPEQLGVEDHNLYKPFLEKAWELLNKNGILLIVTFKGSVDDPVRLIAEKITGKQIRTHSDALYETMIKILNEFGEPKVE